MKTNKDTFAMEILQDYKRVNKRQFIIIILLALSFIGSAIFNCYLLSSIETITTTDTIDINNVDNITDSDIGIR